MQTFRLRRRVDHSGVSGTGVVAEGVIFGRGHVALSWVVAPEGFDQVPLGVAVYESAQHVTAVHGHGGDTWIEYLDCADCSADVSRRAPFLQRLWCRSLQPMPGRTPRLYNIMYLKNLRLFWKEQMIHVAVGCLRRMAPESRRRSEAGRRCHNHGAWSRCARGWSIAKRNDSPGA